MSLATFKSRSEQTSCRTSFSTRRKYKARCTLYSVHSVAQCLHCAQCVAGEPEHCAHTHTHTHTQRRFSDDRRCGEQQRRHGTTYLRATEANALSGSRAPAPSKNIAGGAFMGWLLPRSRYPTCARIQLHTRSHSFPSSTNFLTLGQYYSDG